MQADSILYEGRLFEVTKWDFSKLSKYLRQAFGEVSFVSGEGKTGTLLFAGPCPMFEQDQENLLATFDMLCDIFEDRGAGIVIAKKWGKAGTLDIEQYTLRYGGFEKASLVKKTP